MTFIEKTQEIRKEGKIHWFLLLRLRIILGFSFIMGIVFAYNILSEQLEYISALIFTVVGFVLSFLVFSRMDVVDWDSEKDKIAYRAMDFTAFLIFLVYVCFEIFMHFFLKDVFHAVWFSVVLALMFGSVAGRTAALALKINSVYEKT